VPNENYARELMELHTLGVNGGYTQKDVYEVARCFTGWTMKDNFPQGAFEFRPALHDTGDKTVLGQRIAGRAGDAGLQEGEEVLDLLARHPSTAHFLATKLCRHFIADDPPPGAVTHVAAAFHASSGDIRATLRVVFQQQEFRTPGKGEKMKRPFDFAVSALRG